MKRFSLLALALLIPAFSCWAGDSGSVRGVYMEGGVCGDDPLGLFQTSATLVNGQPKTEFFEFAKECKALGRDGNVVDNPPTAFVCHAGGHTSLAGATYKLVARTTIPSNDDMVVDTRVYLYDCTKSCEHAPPIIQYTVGDCG